MCFFFFFFVNVTATTEIYTLSLHDALPILWGLLAVGIFANGNNGVTGLLAGNGLQIVSQLISMGVVLAWALGTGFLMFLLLKTTMGVRVTASEETLGLDESEHALKTYTEL